MSLRSKLRELRSTDLGAGLIQRAEEAKRRIAICEQCDRYNNTIKVCSECGCIMPVKVRLPMNTCPLGKHDIQDN